jgi:predicted alpha/beta-hydrolase family hydrolase
MVGIPMSPLSFQIPIDGDTPGVGAALYAAEGGARLDAVLVLAHGAGAGHFSPFMTAYAAALSARGVDVVTFNFGYMERGRKTPDRAPVLEETFRRAVAGAWNTATCAGRLFIGGSRWAVASARTGRRPERWPSGPGPVGRRGARLPAGAGWRSKGSRLAPQTAAVPTSSFRVRDPFGGPDEIREAVFRDGATPPIEIHTVDGGDHSFGVLKSSGRDQDAVHTEIQDAIAAWIRR